MSTATEGKHTPGPWSIEKDDFGLNVYSTKTRVYTTYICEDVQSEADAHLIKAAPAMLEALEQLAKQAQFALDSGMIDSGLDSYMSLYLKDAYAAIRLAKGDRS